MPVGANIFQVADVRETSPADSRLFQSSAQAVSTSTHTGAGGPVLSPRTVRIRKPSNRRAAHVIQFAWMPLPATRTARLSLCTAILLAIPVRCNRVHQQCEYYGRAEEV